MKQQFNKIYLLMLILLVAVTPVHAGLWDYLFSGGVDRSEYDQCLEWFSETECSTEFCAGNAEGDKIYCNYDTDTQRLFEAEMYPATCDALNNWNDTEEVRYIFSVNVDSQDYSLNSRVCQGDNEFEQFLKRDSYDVSHELLNRVESSETLWVDSFGLTYLDKPSKAELKEIYDEELVELGTFIFSDMDSYTDGIDYLYNNLEEVQMNDQMFSLLSCQVDCDYTGAGDNNLDMPITTDGKKGGLTFDYTKAAVFVDNSIAVKWKEKVGEDLESACGFWSNLLTFGACSRHEAENINLNNYYDILDRVNSDKDQVYWYSNTNNVINSFTCNYPKDTYANTDVTARVSCVVGKTQEGLFFTNPDDYSWSELGLNTCDDSEYGCLFTMDLTGNLNTTTGNIQHVNQTLTDYNVTDEEQVDDFIDSTTPILGYLLKKGDPTENIELVGQEEERVRLDESIKGVLSDMLELNTYVFSFILLINYFIQIFMFIAAFNLIVSAFQAIRKAFKDLFNVRGNRR